MDTAEAGPSFTADPDSEDDVPLARRVSMKRPMKPATTSEQSDSKKLKLDVKQIKPKVDSDGKSPKLKVGSSDQQMKTRATSVAYNVSNEKKPSSNALNVKQKSKESLQAKSVTMKKTSQSENQKKVTTTVSKKTVVVQKKTSTSQKKEKEQTNGVVVKWNTLEHNGVIFPPPYQPHGVKMLYNGQPVDLTPEQEEVATMFAVMKDTEYATKSKFKENFWNDWKLLLRPKHMIKDLDLCDFTPIYDWHLAEKEKKKQMTSVEKKEAREEKLKLEEKYMWALVDGVKEKVGNFRVEPPGLFRGRGEHPKMGKLKKRIFPEDIVINIGKEAAAPVCPMPGHKWKEIRHDNTVTWLAFWNDPINVKEFKYVFLHATSSLKGQSDRDKYEKARKLKDYIDSIRKTYTKDFNSSDATKKQIAVATYLIDKLALRAGNEKDEDEADTVGCCSLKVEHVKLLPPKSVEFDFLGKDSIRYNNTVEVDERVYKAIGEFKKGKKDGKDLFDKLDTAKLNAQLKEFMPGLSAKVFRTYNASITLDQELETTRGKNIEERVAFYHSANKQVAILCNHQRSVPKAHSTQMEKLNDMMSECEDLVEELVEDLKRAKAGKPPLKDAEGKVKRNRSPEQLEKKIEQTNKKIEKIRLDMRTKDDLKTVALGTSKINYMDPRISVAWCKRNGVPIEKVFNKSLLGKFVWAMDVEPDFRF